MLRHSSIVRSLRGGLVEIQDSGEKLAVQTLIKWLKIGPKFAKVSTIEVIDLPLVALDNQHSIEFEIWSTA